MFARLVDAPAKPGKRNEIIAILENELVPTLNKQHGFVDFIGLTSDTHLEEGITLTIWKTKEDAEKFYGTSEFKSKILDRITPLVETMTIRTFTVEASTFHKITAAKAA
jgi:heme-degrading monooxygenase HmoA